MKETFRQVVAGLAASGAFVLLFGRADYVLWFSLLIAAGVGVGTYLTIPRKKEPHEIDLAPGVTAAQLAAAAERIGSHVEKFHQLAARLRGTETGVTIQNLANTLVLLADHFDDDPADLAKASPFLDQYLERSHDLAVQYVRLSEMPMAGMGEERLAPVRRTLERVEAAFDHLYRQCLGDDLTDLQVSSEMLDVIMDMDLPHVPDKEISKS